MRIEEISIFEGIGTEELNATLGCVGCERLRYKKDNYIKLTGDSADFIGIVLEGTIQVVQDDYNGRRTITGNVTAGHIFAEAFACAGVPGMPVDILAATDCEVILLDKNRILNPCSRACNAHNRIIQNLLKLMAKKNMILNQKLTILSHTTTQEKVLAYLQTVARQEKSNKFTIPFDRQGLADYLGVERSALSAEISKLQKQGVLVTKRSYFELISI